MNLNEETYIKVCQLFFNGGMNAKFIAELIPERLIEYVHLSNEGTVFFDDPEEAVKTIIQCEKQAHKQANPMLDKGKLSRREYAMVMEQDRIEEGFGFLNSEA